MGRERGGVGDGRRRRFSAWGEEGSGAGSRAQAAEHRRSARAPGGGGWEGEREEARGWAPRAIERGEGIGGATAWAANGSND
jgi:hypothetical protein